MADSADFGPSELGTKEYWDQAYTQEIQNYNDHGDIGDIWFGEDSVMKMVQWVEEEYPDPNTRIIDVGCGNGHLLLELAELGYTALTGVDYSAQAIELASTIAKQRLPEPSSVTYHSLNFLDPSDLQQLIISTSTSASSLQWDLVLDKGTFDAISLSAGSSETTQDPKRQYVEAICELLRDNGVLLITSCNWTQEELVKLFQPNLAIIM
ncbi:Protein-lysine N-methyltransferase efm4 [Dispira simplex]|nr:Protein-lysine N-methyltransferase efm4 [Dispira simplex]